jgi:hypothetical protein
LWLSLAKPACSLKYIISFLGPASANNKKRLREMGRKVVLLLELIKPSTLCDNVNGECLISINKESSTSGHIKK